MINPSINRKITLVLFLLLFSLPYVNSQFILDAELRPRAEFRNGFNRLMPDSIDPAFSISQRTRFNAYFNKENIKVYISIQDVRTWGDVGQLNFSDVNGLAIHQAWGEFGIGKYVSVKAGRQELVYDDQRMFGNVGWAQQARSHDALLGKFKKGRLSIELGLAYNQERQALTGNEYTIPNNYKAMQYVWANYAADAVKVSFLFLNNGLQYIDPVDIDSNTTRYSQTYGTHVKARLVDLIDLSGNFYYTGGKDRFDRSMSAYEVALDLNFKPDGAKWSAGVGFEILSGNEITDGDRDMDKNNAFTPFYGTNHKFNGFMDYFYVGNHINTVGLFDLYVRGGYTHKKSKFFLSFHNFMSSASITENNEKQSSQLGSEIDFVYAYIFSKSVNISAGYSQMFAAQSLKDIRPTPDNTYNNVNNWAWIMLTFKPQLFKHDYQEKKEI